MLLRKALKILHKFINLIKKYKLNKNKNKS